MKRPALRIVVLSVLAFASSACGGAATGTTADTSPSAAAGAPVVAETPAPAASSAPGAVSEPQPSAASGDVDGPAAIKTAETPTYGTLLVDADGATLYAFLADDTGQSTCFAECADSWPPVLTAGAAAADGAVEVQLLGVTDRGDGTTQVTYDGRPLYTYSGDTLPGDVLGYASGGVWYPIGPDGAVINDAIEPTEPNAGANY